MEWFERDLIKGMVKEVLDGDTFILGVMFEDPENEYEYSDEETIRLYGVNAPEVDTEQGKKAKRYLEKIFKKYEWVDCEIHSRDEYGRLIADVWAEDDEGEEISVNEEMRMFLSKLQGV